MTSEWTIILILLITIMSSVHAITIVSGPVDVMTMVGETIELQCTIADKGDLLVYWLRGDEYLTFDYAFYEDAVNPRYSIIDKGNPNRLFVLRISDVQVSDAGRYQCGHFEPSPTFENALLSVIGNESPPQGQTPPDEGFPRCEVSPQNPSLGETVRLTCTSQGGDPPAQLRWVQGDNSLTGQSQSPNSVDRTLRENRNGIEYQCRLSHPALNKPRVCTITPLRILPTVRVEPAVVMIDRGGQGALFTCVANGIPDIAIYTFLFDGIEVTLRSDADRFMVTRDFRTLTVRNVIAEDDNVEVRCNVSTPNGLSASASALLRVRQNVTTIVMPTTAGERYIGNMKSSTFFIIIIVIGVVIAQLLFVICVVLMHRALKERREDKKQMMKMEWKGVTLGRRDAHEIVPTLASMSATAPRRYTPLNQSDISHPRYQDLERHSVAMTPSKTTTLEMGVYEGVGTTPPTNAQGNSSPARTPKTSAERSSTPKTSVDSPAYPPPRPTSRPLVSARLPGEDTTPTISSRPPYPSPREQPATGGQRISSNPSEGIYKRPTSNAVSNTLDDSISYQGSVIRSEHVASVCYEEPPIQYFEPISDTVYEVEVLPDGYVCPDPIEDPDIDDYELPPSTIDDYVPV
ncbi:uncharacterized protein [Amphiura filiformis]|uniref:uncharacterized protein n=1 Tax=Amphiura filiformis TaxID=82378 RepID=UPI003B216D33